MMAVVDAWRFTAYISSRLAPTTPHYANCLSIIWEIEFRGLDGTPT